METPVSGGSSYEKILAATANLVDASTVAAHVRQAKSSIYRLAQAGLIPSYAAGPRLRGRRFDLVEVRAALKALARQAVTK
jgi:hypothetical protein